MGAQLNCADDFFQDFCGFLKCGALFVAECGDLLRQCSDPTCAAFHQELLSGRCRGEQGAAAVVCVLLLCDEALLFEGVDDSRHGGRADLLGGGEIAQGDGASEDDDGQGGQPWGVEAGAFVFFAESPQQVDGGGVEMVGDIL